MFYRFFAIPVDIWWAKPSLVVTSLMASWKVELRRKRRYSRSDSFLLLTVSSHVGQFSENCHRRICLGLLLHYIFSERKLTWRTGSWGGASESWTSMLGKSPREKDRALPWELRPTIWRNCAIRGMERAIIYVIRIYKNIEKLDGFDWLDSCPSYPGNTFI